MILFLNGAKAKDLTPPAGDKVPRCCAKVPDGQCTAGARWAYLLQKRLWPVCRTHANKGDRGLVLEVVE